MKKFFAASLSIVAIVFVLIIADTFLLWNNYYNVSAFSYDTEFMRPDTPNNVSNLSPIVTIGCSFVYGTGLLDEDTFAARLQRYTHRKVYNRGMYRWGVQHVLYQLTNDEFFTKIRPPEYIIYVFIDDHIRRMHINFFDKEFSDKYLQYEKYNGALIQKNPNVELLDYLKVTLLYKIVQNEIIKRNNPDDEFDLLKLYLLESKKQVNRLYKNKGTKFVIIKYPNVDLHGYKHFETNRWKELEKQGFIIIDFDDKIKKTLVKPEYLVEDGMHPSEKAWDLVIPLIVNKLSINK